MDRICDSEDITAYLSGPMEAPQYASQDPPLLLSGGPSWSLALTHTAPAAEEAQLLIHQDVVVSILSNAVMTEQGQRGRAPASGGGSETDLWKACPRGEG